MHDTWKIFLIKIMFVILFNCVSDWSRKKGILCNQTKCFKCLSLVKIMGFCFFPQETLENVKKCKNFLITLMKLASSGTRLPDMAQNVRALVKGLLV